MPSDQPSHLKNISLLVLLGIILLVPGAIFAPLIDRDEPRFSQATVEMIDRQDWIIPTFNTQFRFDKPILTYWMMRVSYMLFGVNEFAARFHTILSTLLTAVALYWIGFRWFHQRAGFIAGFTYLTAFQVLLHGRLAVADAPMILGIVLVHLAIFELIRKSHKKYPWPWFFLLYGAVAFGFLAKGPIILFVPILTLVLFRGVLWRKPLPTSWFTLKPMMGFLFATFIIATWGIPALLHTKGAFWDVGINEHIVKRGTEAFNGRVFLFFFYFITFWISFFPWSTRFLSIISFMRHKWNRMHAYLLAWFLSPIIIFSFYATQLPHYILPGFPALCLLIGAHLDDLANHTSKRIQLYTSVRWLLIVIISLIPIVFFVTSIFQPFADKFIPLQKCLLGFAMGLTGIIGISLLDNIKKIWLIITFCIVSSLGFTFALASIRPTVPAVQLAEQMQNMPSNTRFFGYRFFEPSLIFYSNRHWTETPNLDGISALAISQTGPTYFVLREREWNFVDYWKYLTQEGSLPKPKELAHNQKLASTISQLKSQGFQLKTIEGLNLGRTSWVKLHILWRE